MDFSLIIIVNTILIDILLPSFLRHCFKYIFVIQINQGQKQLAKPNLFVVYLHGNQTVFEIGIWSQLVTYKELESLRKMDTFLIETILNKKKNSTYQFYTSIKNHFEKDQQSFDAKIALFENKTILDASLKIP